MSKCFPNDDLDIQRKSAFILNPSINLLRFTEFLNENKRPTIFKLSRTDSVMYEWIGVFKVKAGRLNGQDILI